MNRVDLVVFDMVGTTVESSPKVPEAFRAAYEVAGIALSEEDISSVRGKSKREAILELLERNDKSIDLAKSVYDAFRSYLVDCYRDGPVNPVPGAYETFSWCRDHEIQVALTTGFDREVANLLIAHLGWGDAVDVAQVASVGDTVSDLDASVTGLARSSP